MADYFTFGAGLLVASLGWFALFTLALLQLVLALHKSVGEQVANVRQTLVSAREHALCGNLEDVNGSLGEALHQLDTLMSTGEAE